MKKGKITAEIVEGSTWGTTIITRGASRHPKSEIYFFSEGNIGCSTYEDGQNPAALRTNKDLRWYPFGYLDDAGNVREYPSDNPDKDPEGEIFEPVGSFKVALELFRKK